VQGANVVILFNNDRIFAFWEKRNDNNNNKKKRREGLSMINTSREHKRSQSRERKERRIPGQYWRAYLGMWSSAIVLHGMSVCCSVLSNEAALFNKSC
jgi:hypothetical protein